MSNAPAPVLLTTKGEKRMPTRDYGMECADTLRARRLRLGGHLEPAQRAQLDALEAIGK